MKTELKKSVIENGKVEKFEGQLYTLSLLNREEEISEGKTYNRKQPLFERNGGKTKRDLIPDLSIKFHGWNDVEPPIVSVGTTSYFEITKDEVEEYANNLLKCVRDAEAFEEVLKEMEEYNSREFAKAFKDVEGE